MTMQPVFKKECLYSYHRNIYTLKVMNLQDEDTTSRDLMADEISIVISGQILFNG